MKKSKLGKKSAYACCCNYSDEELQETFETEMSLETSAQQASNKTFNLIDFVPKDVSNSNLLWQQQQREFPLCSSASSSLTHFSINKVNSIKHSNIDHNNKRVELSKESKESDCIKISALTQPLSSHLGNKLTTAMIATNSSSIERIKYECPKASTQQQQQTQKSTTIQNKCHLNELTKVSYQRQVEALTSKTEAAVEKQKFQCELLELQTVKNLKKEEAAATEEKLNKNLAQRKAYLKSAFFENYQQNKTANNITTKPLLQSSIPKVKQLVQIFENRKSSMIVNNQTELANGKLLAAKIMEQRNSPLSDEGCNLGQSPYSSDNEDLSSGSALGKRKEKVARSASSDSALGLEVEGLDEPMETAASPPTAVQARRMTLTVTDIPLRTALLPLAEPTALPDSPTTEDLQQTLHQSTAGVINPSAVPSKVLLEERVVEIPVEDANKGTCDSRRESSQSCVSDYPSSECGGVRFMRTPSVVVSDYSDDVMYGITLEEIEYFRAQRRRRSSLDTAGTEKDSDISAASSCSNLNYCGSTISALDGAECYVNGMRMPLDRKISDCSVDEEDSNSFGVIMEEQTSSETDNISNMLAAQHLSCKRAKKVGASATSSLSPNNSASH